MKSIILHQNEVQAALEGRLSQIRRVIKPKYSNTHIDWFTNKYGTRLCEIQNDDETTHIKNPDGTTTHKLRAVMELAPRYCVGDILYARETWRNAGAKANPYAYFADEQSTALVGESGNVLLVRYKWQPSSRMPREAARIFLRVTTVRAERVQEISEADVRAEGVVPETVLAGSQDYFDETYKDFWNALNAKCGHAWYSNPWTWVYTIERTDKPLTKSY